MTASTNVTLISKPTIVVLAEMQPNPAGLEQLVRWLRAYAPQCLDEALGDSANPWPQLLPHDLSRAPMLAGYQQQPFGPLRLTGNELLVELAGRKCYNSFGRQAGRRSNAAYLANLHGAPGKIPHGSVFYHAKMSFFFAGISRRMSHELIRNYVGADRSEEGSPSQESTRYTHHPGHFVLHPRVVGDRDSEYAFAEEMRRAYASYRAYIAGEVAAWKDAHSGIEPKGMARKRIYEAAAMLLPGAAATSMVWTTNPGALAKLFAERCDSAADLEFQRFANELRECCYERWPNLFRASNPACDREVRNG